MANEVTNFNIGGVDHAVQDVGARQLIADLQAAINAITSGDTTTAIKTFQEVIDFLDGVTDNATLIGKLNELRTLIAAKYSKPASGIPASDLADGVIPDVSGFATKTEVNAKANDNAVVKSVTINGQTPQLNNGNINLGTIHDGADGEDGITPHIGQDGYWYIGTTNTGVKAQGERGNDGVASADEWVVVNNLDGEPADLEEGQVAVMGAEQGKELKMAIDNKGVSFKAEGDTLFIRTASSPMVNVLPTSIQFDDTIFGNTRTATVHVYGRNLTNQVEVQVSGVGFSGSAQLLPNGDGKVDADVTITFAPTANTGTEAVGGRSYEGSVTAVCDGAESASATLEGFGVLTITPRITASIDKSALKGVLDTTADGQYSSEPATATLHVQASNINQPLTLAVDNGKFALSESQVSAEDAKRGKDITVTYLRQSAVTDTDDECTITITAAYDNTTAQSTVAVSGATAAKKTSGTIATIDGVEYYFYPGYESEGVYVKKSGSGPSGDLVIDSIFDAYGYKYAPHSVNTDGFKNVTTLTSLKLGSSVVTLYDNAFAGCSGLKHVEWNNLTASRNSMFSGCSNLETLEFVVCNTFVSYTSAFSSCTKLKEVTIKRATKHGISYEGTFAPSETITVDGSEKKIYYYEDAQGNHQQKKLYVPSGLVSQYQQDAIWGMFDVQPISE